MSIYVILTNIYNNFIGTYNIFMSMYNIVIRICTTVNSIHMIFISISDILIARIYVSSLIFDQLSERLSDCNTESNEIALCSEITQL